MSSAARAFAVVLLLATPVLSQPADSVADFSGVQGQGEWSYGIYNQGPAGGAPHGYAAAAFVELDDFDPGSQTWRASDSLVGAQNNDFLSLDATGGHPTGLGPGGQDSIIWAVRRYVAPAAGLARIEVDLRKDNVVNPRGGGITGRVFVDGAEVFTQLIENDDDDGVRRILREAVQAGSTIDFAIDPTGITPVDGSDGVFSARADGSTFTAAVSYVPEPATVTAIVALVVFNLRRRLP